MKQVFKKLARPPFLAALCAAEAAVILRLCTVFIIRIIAPPPWTFRFDAPHLNVLSPCWAAAPEGGRSR